MRFNTLVEEFFRVSDEQVQDCPSKYIFTPTIKKRNEQWETVSEYFNIIVPNTSYYDEYAKDIGKIVINDHRKWEQTTFVNWGKTMASCMETAKKNYWVNVDDMIKKYGLRIIMDTSMKQYLNERTGFFHYLSSMYEVEYHAIAIIQGTEYLADEYGDDIAQGVETEVTNYINRGLTDMISYDRISSSVESIRVISPTYVYNITGICIGLYIRREISEDVLAQIRRVKIR